MVVYTLDASAVLRWLDGEQGAAAVEAMLELGVRGHCRLVISAVNWGEVVGKLHQRQNDTTGISVLLERIASKGLEIVPATAERARRAALLRVRFGIGYADCFGIELASDSPDHILVPADYGAKPAESLARIEFLPNKQIP